MLKIYIYDDDELFLSEVRRVLQVFFADKMLDAGVRTFHSWEMLKEILLTGQEKPDLLFLDIEAGEHSGIDIAKEINQSWPSIQIAFLTNYVSYATDVYETEHFYYVLKDELKERLPLIIKRYYEGKQKICIRTKRKDWCFDTDEILYIERGRRYGYVVTKDARKEKIPISFENLLEQLSDACFLRCHNSFLVNLNQIRSYQTEMITMEDGSDIPISRSYRLSSRERFLKWQEIWI